MRPQLVSHSGSGWGKTGVSVGRAPGHRKASVRIFLRDGECQVEKPGVCQIQRRAHTTFLEGGGDVLSGTGCRTGTWEPVGKRPQIMPSWELPVEVFGGKKKKKHLKIQEKFNSQNHHNE